jgi:hypothetical protein
MYLPAPTESNFAPVPAGTHLGICYRVIDLGTQSTNFNGETKLAHKVLVSWEIPDEKMDDGRPFTISQSYTWSMHEKATLRKSLEAGRGMAFTERDFGPSGFDIKNVLGKACTLSIVHTAKNGTTYANVASIGKVMKGVTIPPLTNPQVYLWLNSARWDAAAFAGLSANLQGKIMSSPEYLEMMKTTDDGNGNHHHSDDMSEDIPF